MIRPHYADKLSLTEVAFLMDPNPKKKENRFTIVISDENIVRYHLYSTFIYNHLKARNPVPARLFKKFLSLLKVELSEKEILGSIRSNIVQDILDRFSDKAYQFKIKSKLNLTPLRPKMNSFPNMNWTPMNDDKKAEFITYDLASLVRHVLIDLHTKEMADENKWKKDYCVKEAYLSIENFAKSHFKPAHHKAYTHRKRSALATYICIKKGYKYTKKPPKNGEKYSVSELFNMSKHAINQIPEGKTRFKPESKKKPRTTK